jgi:hypothetical protein
MDLTFAMMRTTARTARKLAATAAVALLLNGCLKTEEFPVEPALTFKEFKAFGDSASVVVKFTDGDGDIGLGQGDTTGAYAPGQTYYHNLFVEYYTLENNVWSDPFPFTLPLYYRVPVVTPTGQNKALEGELAVALRPWPTLPGTSGDTIRYSVMLVDRALHESNVVFTDAIVVP